MLGLCSASRASRRRSRALSESAIMPIQSFALLELRLGAADARRSVAAQRGQRLVLARLKQGLHALGKLGRGVDNILPAAHGGA